ncbi:MAG: 50S ribosomal protein L21e [Candidatus Micrarchaeota archaeon]|nr:50S ribosomal protein L21e [Candidatus Micrarchaeota archaeon]
MVKRSLGQLSKRTRLLRRKTRTKLSVGRIMREFNEGDRVSLDYVANQRGMPHPRYRGRSGVIVGKRGKAYIVEIRDMTAVKHLVVPGVHLR